jgi:hypothetical protein
MAASEFVVTVKMSAALAYAQQMAEILDAAVDLIPEWMTAERDALTAKFDAALDGLRKGITTQDAC